METINQNPLQNFIITQDGEVTHEYDPSGLELARSAVLDGLSRAVGHVRLEARMLAFDALHGTQYRKLRHMLVEEQKRARFEASIGLIATK